MWSSMKGPPSQLRRDLLVITLVVTLYFKVNSRLNFYLEKISKTAKTFKLQSHWSCLTVQSTIRSPPPNSNLVRLFRHCFHNSIQILIRSTTSLQFLVFGLTFANVLIRRCLKCLRLLMGILTLYKQDFRFYWKHLWANQKACSANLQKKKSG